MLCQSTCVGLGYGLDGGLFPGTAQQPLQSDKEELHLRSVTFSWLRNIHLIPIAYAFRPRLRGRLTLLRLASSRNPWTFGGRVSHPPCRYSCQHSHFRPLHRALTGRLHRRPRSDHPCSRENRQSRKRSRTERSATSAMHSKASARGLSPVTSSPQDSLSRPVSCYAFFK